MNMTETVWRELSVVKAFPSTWNASVEIDGLASTRIEYDSILHEGAESVRRKVEIKMVGYGVSELIVNGEVAWKASDPINKPVAPGTVGYAEDVDGRMVVAAWGFIQDMAKEMAS